MAKKKPTDTHPDQIDNGLRADLGTLANELRLRTEERDRVASERGRWSNLLKQADEAVEHATAAIVAASRPGQLTLIQPAGKANVDEADPDELEIADDRTTLSGTTGAPIGDSVPWEMTPSDEDPNLCVCGWEIASPIPGHDRRHAQFVKSLAEEPAITETSSPKPSRPAKSISERRRAATKKNAKLLGKKKAARR